MQKSIRLMSAVIVVSLMVQGPLVAVYPSNALPKQGKESESAQVRQQIDLLKQKVTDPERENCLEHEKVQQEKKVYSRGTQVAAGFFLGGAAAVLAWLSRLDTL